MADALGFKSPSDRWMDFYSAIQANRFPLTSWGPVSNVTCMFIKISLLIIVKKQF